MCVYVYIYICIVKIIYLLCIICNIYYFIYILQYILFVYIKHDLYKYMGIYIYVHLLKSVK